MLDILRNGPAHTPSLHEVESADAVFILGEDVTNVAPRMALSLRQSVRQQPMQIAERAAHPAVDGPWRARGGAGRERAAVHRQHRRHAAGRHRHAHVIAAAPDDLARLGFAVANALDSRAPAPSDLSEAMLALAAEIAQALKSAKRPLVISGPS